MAFILFTVLCIFCMMYYFISLLCAFYFVYKRKKELKEFNHWKKVASNPTSKDHSPSQRPFVTILKPICGSDEYTKENLESFLQQSYQNFQMIVGMASEQDSALLIVQNLQKQYPQLKIVQGEHPIGANKKVRNLLNIQKYIDPTSAIWIIADADLKVDANYIERIVHNFSSPQIGCVTCLYTVKKTPNWGSLPESLYIEQTFAPGVLLSSSFAPLNYALGATIAVDKQIFLETGGFEKLLDYLADDNIIGKRIAEAKKKVKLSTYIVEDVLSYQSITNTFKHLLRWNRTIRICQSIGYFFSMITYMTPWLLLYIVTALYFQKNPWFLVTIALTLRILQPTAVAFALQNKYTFIRAFLAPLWDFISFCLWFVSFQGNTITWRDTTYHLHKDGTMHIKNKEK
ncbi:MAG TPA: glycosyltransferase [Planctomycetota bacterium]|nr:glycosyltransferase [Planctomycetota bacterium]